MRIYRSIQVILFATIIVVASSSRADVAVRFAANAGGIPTPDTTLEQATGWIDLNGGDGSTKPSFDPDNPTVQSASFIVGARHGAVRAASLAVITGGQSFATGVSVSGSAWFDDMLTIDAPGLTGQTGMTQMTMILDGLISEAVPGNEQASSADALVDFEFSASSSQGNPTTGVSYGDNNERDNINVNHEYYLLDVPFVFGEPFEISARLETKANTQQANFPGNTSAISAFAQTATWQGIEEVLDSGGQPVLDYSVSSDSLTDYRGPIGIPEPSAVVLLVGVASLAFCIRRLA